jgi:hypothetical protein
MFTVQLPACICIHFVWTVRFLVKSRDSSLVHSVQTTSGTHPNSYPKVTGSPFLGWSDRDVKLTANLLAQGSRQMKHLHRLLRLHDLLLNYMSTGRTCSSTPNLKVMRSSEKSVKFGFATWRYIPEYILFFVAVVENKSSKVCLCHTV